MSLWIGSTLTGYELSSHFLTFPTFGLRLLDSKIMFSDLVPLGFKVAACPTWCSLATCSAKWGLQMTGRSSQALNNQKNQHLMWRGIATTNSHSLVLHQCNQLLLGAHTQRIVRHTSYGRHQTYSIVRLRGAQTTLATFQKDSFPSLASCQRASKQIACLTWWL